MMLRISPLQQNQVIFKAFVFPPKGSFSHHFCFILHISDSDADHLHSLCSKIVTQSSPNPFFSIFSPQNGLLAAKELVVALIIDFFIYLSSTISISSLSLGRGNLCNLLFQTLEIPNFQVRKLIAVTALSPKKQLLAVAPPPNTLNWSKNAWATPSMGKKRRVLSNNAPEGPQNSMY